MFVQTLKQSERARQQAAEPRCSRSSESPVGFHVGQGKSNEKIRCKLKTLSFMKSAKKKNMPMFSDINGKRLLTELEQTVLSYYVYI